MFNKLAYVGGCLYASARIGIFGESEFVLAEEQTNRYYNIQKNNYIFFTQVKYWSDNSINKRKCVPENRYFIRPVYVSYYPFNLGA